MIVVTAVCMTRFIWMNSNPTILELLDQILRGFNKLPAKNSCGMLKKDVALVWQHCFCLFTVSSERKREIKFVYFSIAR